MKVNIKKRCICKSPETCNHYKVDGVCIRHFRESGSDQSNLNIGAEVQRCIDKGCGRKVYKEGLCWTHFKDAKHESTQTRVSGGSWRGSLNMGKRLTEMKKEKARKGGGYGDTVHIPSFMLK